ncbi:MAG TPA: T9SS type A sorting domain-containing protein [Candidatus Kapabacteria bacterium]|nr:T9SS type A sorting domain-containing protein [Candidatus Kapabacteria bacterium]
MRRSLQIILLLLWISGQSFGQWKNISSGKIPPLSLIYGYSGVVAYHNGTLALGFTNEVWVTNDLGKTWRSASPFPPGDAITDIDIFDSANIVAGATAGIAQSFDGGRNYDFVPNIPNIYSVKFVDAKNSLVASNHSGIYTSPDYGANWQHRFVAFTDSEVTNIRVRANGEICALNLVRPTFFLNYLTQFLVSDDGGVTWATYTGNIDYDCYSFDLDACNPNLITIVNEEHYAPTDHSACFYISVDRGLSWSVRRPVTDLLYYTGGISIAPGGMIFAQTSSQGVLRSTDYGNNWGNIGGPSGLLDSRLVYAASPDTIFAVDGSGGVWMTTNCGGASGNSPDPISSPLIFSTDTLFVNSISTLCDSLIETIHLARGMCPSPSIMQIIPNGNAASDYQVVSQAKDSLTIQFKPSKGGSRGASLNCVLTDGSTQTITLLGKGLDTGYTIHRSADSLFMFDTLLYCDQDTQGVAIHLSGCNMPSLIGWKVGGNDTNDFRITGTSGDSVIIRFVPTAQGLRRGLLIARLSDGKTDTTRLGGFGIDPGIALTAAPTMLFQNDTILTCKNITRGLRIHSSICVDRRIASQQISGGASGDYALVQKAPDPLTGDDSLTILFSPSASGLRNASYVLTLADSTRIAIPFNGTGEGPGQQFGCDHTSLFASDSVKLCSSITRGFRIHSNECINRIVASQIISGLQSSEYHLDQSAPNPLTGDDSITITFTPAQLGTRAAVYTLQIGSGEHIDLPLMGICVNAPYILTVSADSLFQADNLFLCDSSDGLVTIHKTDCAIVKIISHTIIGPAAGDYTITGVPQDSMLSDNSFSLHFAPSDTIVRNAMLEIILDDGKKIDITLHGSGRPPGILRLAKITPITATVIGEDIHLPIEIEGLTQPETVELNIIYDPLNLNYTGTTSISGAKLDIAGTTTPTSSRIHIPASAIQLGAPSAFANFIVYADTAVPASVSMSGLQVIAPQTPCAYVVDTIPIVAASINIATGCGYSTISNFVRWNELPRLKIYPNPTGGLLNIESSESLEGAVLEVANVVGTVCIKKECTSERSLTATLDLSSLASGMYYLRVKSNGAIILLPIIVEK